MSDVPERQSPLPPLIRALRPYQWAKNLLLGVPLLMSHQFRDLARLERLGIAFAAFCLVASAGYILNDINDIESDRRHERKRNRPFASGQVTVGAGMIMAFLMLVAAAGIAWSRLGTEFLGLLGLYFTASIAYSFDLKRRLIIDVITLAGLYTLRLIAGGAAAGVAVSPWLLALSMFFFLSLAFSKRYAELIINSDDNGQLRGRSYLSSDLSIIESIGPTSGYIAVMVLALYVNSDMSKGLYRRPDVLWLICPIALYWITRIWFLAKRKALVDDPLLFALTDRTSWVCVVITALIAWAAS